MENEITTYNFKIEDVNTQVIDDTIWFRLADIAKTLDMSDNSVRMMKSRGWFDKDEINTVTICDGTSGNPTATYISESALYRILNRSNSPKARPFERWVTKEVLPSIRKHGIYATPVTIDNILADPDYGIKLLTELKETRKKAKELQEQLDTSKEWYTIKRVASINGVSYKEYSWKLLKDTSKKMGVPPKKIFDANYGEVNLYHYSVWEKVYPEAEL